MAFKQITEIVIDSPESRELLETKLEELGKTLKSAGDDYKSPEQVIAECPVYQFLIAQRLLQNGSVTARCLAKEFKKKHSVFNSWLFSHAFNEVAGYFSDSKNI